MREIFNSEEMRRFEQGQFLKKNSYSFMQKAGKKVFEFISKNFKNIKSIIILCGPGNNGGDGFVIAKHLMEQGYSVKVYIYVSENYYKGDALKALREFRGELKKIDLFKLQNNTLIVDALFGIGLKRNIKGILGKVFRKINKSNNTVVAVDIPSGVCSNTGEILGNAIKANFTITFHRKKIGHVISFGKQFCGKLKVVDIGFSQKKLKSRCWENSPDLWKKYFPWKRTFDHKYSRGRVVVHGGQKEFTGASILSAQAALRTGTGSVKIVCSKSTLQIYSIKFPSVLKKEINNIYQLEDFIKKEKITSFLIGPGAGSNKNIKEVTKLILKKVKYVVLDADALTCFRGDLKSLYSLLDKDKIITPHIGEFHKIFPNIKKNLNNIDKVFIASRLIRSNIILKGPNTVIASYNKKIVINNHASPELAVIGSGDVLSGLVVSLMGQEKMDPFLAGCAGTWLHGDIAKHYGKGLIAEDLVQGISNAFKEIKKMEELLKKEPVKRVKEFISQFNPKLKVLVLNTTARTAKDAAESLGCEVGAIVKSLVFRAEDTFLICLVAGDKRCSLNKLKKIINKKDVCMANADEVKINTGFSIGGVAPIAHLKKLSVLIDQSLSRFQSVFAAGGHPNSIFKIEYSQLVQITKGAVKEIIE